MANGASGGGDRRIGGSPGPAAGRRPPPRRRRLPIWKLLVFAAATALLFFGLLEGGLALLRVRPIVETEDPYVGFVSNLPLYVEEEQPDGTRLMVTARNKLAYFNPQKFSRRKPPGTFRIFCLGGSTTFGHPYDDRSSYPGWLREILNDGDASRAVGGHQRRRRELRELPRGGAGAGAGAVRAGSVRRLLGPQRVPGATNLRGPRSRPTPRSPSSGRWPDAPARTRSCARRSQRPARTRRARRRSATR